MKSTKYFIQIKIREIKIILSLNRKEGVFKMIKTIILKLLVKLTANFLLRYLVKKYISRIFWPHMNVLLTYRNKHVHIIIYIFS